MICVLFIAAIAGCGARSSEPYRYGNLVADVPDGWSSTEITTPGSTVVTFSENFDDTSPTLFWLEVTPLVDVSPKKLVMSIAEYSGLTRIKTRTEHESSMSFELTIDGEIESEPVGASFYAYKKNAELYVLGFVADPQRFSTMDGEQLPLDVFNAGSPIDVSAAVGGQQPPPPARVLAEAGDFRLTQQMLDDTVAFAEFLAARTIDTNDKLDLRREIIDQFPSSTQEDHEAYRDVGTLVRQLGTVGALKQAEVRREMMNRIWFDAQLSGEESPFLDLVYRYNPVLGSDERLGLVALRVSFDALLASNSFVATKAGLDPLTPAERDAFAEQVSKEYESMNDRQKRYLADGEVSWLKLITVWQTWDEQKQNEQMRIVGVNGIKSAEQVPQVARNLEHWAGIDASVQEVRKLMGLQGDMMVLQHLRSTLSVYGPHE